MALVLFAVCLFASTAGAVAGFGGGVIIKPVLDAFGILPVSTVSFLSGCTVLGMSAASLIRGRNDGVKLMVKTSTPLAVGAAAGGLLGKTLFDLVRVRFADENMLGLIQTALLLLTTVVVLIYVIKKDRMSAMQVEHMAVCLLIGVFLGGISSFLGIGGGPINVAVLFFFFSMDAKTAAKNSIYIILFSQVFNLAAALVKGNVPAFSVSSLVLMTAGGIAGAILGAEISRRLDSKKVEKLLYALMILIIGINCYNLVSFALVLRF